MKSGRMCTSCKVKYAQDGEVCRTCWNEAGGYRSTAQRDAERLARRDAKLAALMKPEPEAREPVVYRIGGEEYEVVWDGR